MAYYDTTWYTHSGDGSTTGYYAVPKRAQNAAVAAGALARQFTAPAAGSERVFVCIVAGTTANTTDATWVLTRGSKTTDGTVTWIEVTGMAAVNGDNANVVNWTTAKGIGLPTVGTIIKRNSGTSFQICSVSGNVSASEPAFSDTPGASTVDNQVTWICIGLTTAFATWAAPHARLMNAVTVNWAAGGNDVYIADNSAETGSAQVSLSPPGNFANPLRIMSVDHTAALPAAAAALKPGASINTSYAAANALYVGSSAGQSAYYYGITFINSGTYAGYALTVFNSYNGRARFEACSFQITGGNASTQMSMGASGAYIEFINCTFGFSNAAQMLVWLGSNITWRNTSDPVIVGTIPTVFSRAFQSGPALLLIEGVDLTSLGANTFLHNATSGILATLKNCKLHSGPVMIAGQTATEAITQLDVIDSDSGATNYRNERHNGYGDLTTSTAVVRTGGATDGVTPVSHFIQSSTFARPWRPFEGFPLVIWNDLVGSPRTVTVYGIVLGSAALPLNDQFWFDLFYMGSTATPIAALVSNGLPTQLTPHSQIAVADGSAWSGAGSTNAPFALSATFTPQQKGYITIYPKVGTSYAVYIDPKPIVV